MNAAQGGAAPQGAEATGTAAVNPKSTTVTPPSAALGHLKEALRILENTHTLVSTHVGKEPRASTARVWQLCAEAGVGCGLGSTGPNLSPRTLTPGPEVPCAPCTRAHSSRA